MPLFTQESHHDLDGLAESKIRHLISSLEHNTAIKTVHINPASFQCIDKEYQDKFHSAWFVGVDFYKSEKACVDLTNDVNRFVKVLYKQSTYNKVYKAGMEVSCKYVGRKQLSQYLSKETLDNFKPKSLSQKRKYDACSTNFDSNRSKPNKRRKTGY